MIRNDDMIRNAFATLDLAPPTLVEVLVAGLRRLSDDLARLADEVDAAAAQPKK